MEESLWKRERVPGEVELAICRAGRGPDPVVCLHGITAQHRAFNAAARYLEASRGIVGVDLRGRGDSDKPEAGYSLEAHAADVVRVLDHLGLESAVLAGHSMGGFVALKTALMFPERVRAIVLLDGGWPRVESTPEELTEEEKQEAAALEEGLARAFKRLDMTFESPEAYLDFWFPNQNLKMDDLPQDLADYYLYQLDRRRDARRGLSCRAGAGLAGLLPWQRPAHLRRGSRHDGRTTRHPHGDTAGRRESLHDAMARVHASMGSQGLRSTLLGALSLNIWVTLLRRLQP